MTATPAPLPDHLTGEDDFGAQLDALVRHHIGNLTASHAVDEANGDVLDALIDSAVEEQQETIDARAIRRRESLRRLLSGLATDQATAEASADDALARVRALASQVHALRTRVAGADGPEAVNAPAIYSVFEVQRLRDFAAQRRTILERDSRESLNAARTRSSSRLLVKRDAAVRHAEATARRLQDRVQRHDAAVVELDAALERFRGQPNAMPSAVIPAVAQEAAHGAA
jgi:hypothetical protein